MELDFGPEVAGFRDEARDWLAEHLVGEFAEHRGVGGPTDAEAWDVRLAWDRELAFGGWLGINWPKEYGGRGLGLLEEIVFAYEYARADAPYRATCNALDLLGPMLIAAGSEAQRQRFLPPILAVEELWAQGFSEPGAGSDLASLRTRGELRDGRWIINGQKIWTSYARQCHYMFALVRTEAAAPKHQGISYLLIDLNQPGIDIRPLKQINGANDFNEVFFTDASTPADWIVGERGDGWSVSKSLLKYERNMLGGIDRSEDLFNSLLGLARRAIRDGKPAIEDTWVRERLAALKAELEVQRYSGQIQLTREISGQGGGLLQMMNKLAQSNFAASVAEVSNAILEDEALISPIGNQRPGNERWVNQYMNSLAAAIAGGTSNIQRNIIAERGLGLPRGGETE